MIISINELNIEENISYGATSIVYKGKYKYLSVAIKKISLPSMDIKQIKMILNEILILDRLKHPHIIRVMGFSIDETGELYIVS